MERRKLNRYSVIEKTYLNEQKILLLKKVPLEVIFACSNYKNNK